jgi:hypothetical protein
MIPKQQKASPDLVRQASLEDSVSVHVEQRRASHPSLFSASSSAPMPSTLLLHSASLEQSISTPYKPASPYVDQYTVQLQRYQQYLQVQRNRAVSNPHVDRAPVTSMRHAKYGKGGRSSSLLLLNYRFERGSARTDRSQSTTWHDCPGHECHAAATAPTYTNYQFTAPCRGTGKL